MSMAAASPVRHWPLCEVAEGRDVTIKLIRTPAEEFGGGTVLLLQRGVLDDVTMAMMVHLAPEEAPVRALRSWRLECELVSKRKLPEVLTR